MNILVVLVSILITHPLCVVVADVAVVSSRFHFAVASVWRQGAVRQAYSVWCRVWWSVRRSV
jgi:hypothetical protein